MDLSCAVHSLSSKDFPHEHCHPPAQARCIHAPGQLHTGAWRYPGAWRDANFNFTRLKYLAQRLEQGRFDAFFMADHLAVLNMPMEALRRSHTVTSFEPFTLLSALAQHTTHLGLVATASTTFEEPFHIARRFASLDHLSEGRAGTSSPPATPMRRAISVWKPMWNMPTAMRGRASSTMW